MVLRGVSILNYKNIEQGELILSPKINCFTGNNGMGKTNILDAIYYLSFCRSFITPNDMAVVREGSDFMMLRGRYERKGEIEDISFGLQLGKRKSLKRNGKEYSRLSQHIGLLPLVMVSPMDWELIRGGSDVRRRFIDQIISQSDKGYLANLIAYTKGVENRNVMLKKGYRDAILFETIETQISDMAQAIHAARTEWIKRFSPILLNYYQAISGGKELVKLVYKSPLNERSMLQIMNDNRAKDAALGYTSEGVHRDDIELMLGALLMRKGGSQGQCKTYTVALRFAQYDFLKEHSGVSPLLLLDDIFDKLDANRVESIMSIVARNTFGQIFVTDTNRTHLDEIIRRIGGDYNIYNVTDGVCESVNLLAQ
ncbi:MAG: DNA replication and repair protein RecF [Bacteroidales bacterium]